jgi:hypothetical protein
MLYPTTLLRERTRGVNEICGLFLVGTDLTNSVPRMHYSSLNLPYPTGSFHNRISAVVIHNITVLQNLRHLLTVLVLLRLKQAFYFVMSFAVPMTNLEP